MINQINNQVCLKNNMCHLQFCLADNSLKCQVITSGLYNDWIEVVTFF